jgi:hypothetical protein
MRDIAHQRKDPEGQRDERKLIRWEFSTLSSDVGKMRVAKDAADSLTHQPKSWELGLGRK